MALYCQECSEDLFGRDFGDFAGESTPDETRQGIYTSVCCEGCGHIEVDHLGRRILRPGEAKPAPPATPDTRARHFRDGGVSICWTCGLQLMRTRGGFFFELVRDPLGHEHRVHKACLAQAVGDGITHVKPAGQ